MDYQQTLQYLYSQLPMFTRVGAAAIKADLTNTIALCKLLGNPQHKFKSVHVAGTNGKGSTSHMLAAVLQSAGFKTGLYTSPHLRDFRERIRINGEMISEQSVIDFVAGHQSDFEHIQPSFFEMTVALAFDHFAKEKVDIAIVEVGLGGRLDSTNIITPLVSAITNIGWDHMNILGDTLPQIASEKAGIIKQRVPVIIGEYQADIADVFIQKAQQLQAPLIFASEEWDVDLKVKSQQSKEANDQDFLELDIKKREASFATRIASQESEHRPHTDPQHLQLDLTGSYQLKNVKTVLAVIDVLNRHGFDITPHALKTGLNNVKGLTGLHGRWEKISTSPLTICDTGHNPEGIQEVLKNIAGTPHEHLHMVIGMVNDKDITKILDMLPANAIYYFCKPDIPRGLDADSLREKAERTGLKGERYTSVKEALHAAQAAASAGDLVFVGGSTFVVAEVI